MIQLLRNHYYRLLENKSKFIMNVVLIVIAILGALFINQKTTIEFHIAVVGDSGDIASLDNVYIEQLQELPAKSELILGNYGAIVDFSKNKYEILTVKNDEFKSNIKSMIEGSNKTVGEEAEVKDIPTSIMGYVMVIVFMCGLTSAYLFLEDKEKHVMKRILYSDISQFKLISSYFIFIYLQLFIITMAIIVILMKFFQLDLGMSLSQYAISVAVLCLISTSFGLFNASLFQSEDQANMLGNMLVLISSMMSGSFFQAPNSVMWFHAVTNILPQKHYLNLVTSISEYGYGGLFTNGLIYIIIISLVFLFFTVFNNNKEYSS